MEMLWLVLCQFPTENLAQIYERKWGIGVDGAVGALYGFYFLESPPGPLVSINLQRMFYPSRYFRISGNISFIQVGAVGTFSSNNDRKDMVAFSADLSPLGKAWTCCAFGEFPEITTLQEAGAFYFSLSLAEPFVNFASNHYRISEEQGFAHSKSIIVGIWAGPKVSMGLVQKTHWLGLNTGLRFGFYEMWGSPKLEHPFMVKIFIGAEVWF
jgi:hypothetical protein